MLTIFALPKAFQGHIKVIQTNAIHSWTQLRPSCEIILLGNEDGTAETAAEFGARHLPDVERNEYGTPLLSSLFETAQKAASRDLMSYVNADIILTQSFLEAIRRVQKQQFLLIGRRWDLDVAGPIEFSSPDWEKGLLTRLNETGKLHGRSGLDYFVFPRGIYQDIPPFAIGRTAWDNWLIYRARSLNLPVIEATGTITVIHQNHEYARFQTGDQDSTGGEKIGTECIHNRQLLGSPYYSFNTWDATHILAPDGLRPAKSIKYQLWRLFRIPEMHPRLFRIPEMHPRLIPLAGIIRVLRAIAYRSSMIRQLYSKLLK